MLGVSTFEKNTNVENLIINHLNGERVKKNMIFLYPFFIIFRWVIFRFFFYFWGFARFNLSVLNKLRLLGTVCIVFTFYFSRYCPRLLRRWSFFFVIVIVVVPAALVHVCWDLSGREKPTTKTGNPVCKWENNVRSKR